MAGYWVRGGAAVIDLNIKNCSDQSHGVITLTLFMVYSLFKLSFPGALDGKESACNLGDLGSIPGSGRSPGEGNGNPLQYSCLGNPMDRGTWWATVHWVTKS